MEYLQLVSSKEQNRILWYLLKNQTKTTNPKKQTTTNPETQPTALKMDFFTSDPDTSGFHDISTKTNSFVQIS